MINIRRNHIRNIKESRISFVRRGFMSMWMMRVSHWGSDFKSMLRIVFIVRLAISRFLPKISLGLCQRAEEDRNIALHRCNKSDRLIDERSLSNGKWLINVEWN